jgi:alcohol dehydrogenase (cytochrome c)
MASILPLATTPEIVTCAHAGRSANLKPATPRRFPRRAAGMLAGPLLLMLLGTGCERGPGDDEEARPAAVAPPAPAFPVVSDSLIAAGAGTEWPAYAGNLANHSFSPLDQINTGSVGELVPVWIYSTGIEGALETSPVVVGNTLYATTAGGRVVALNAATGEELWTFDPEPAVVTLCCGPTNRGVSAWGENVYVASLDARLLALNARSGTLVWEADLGDPDAGFSAVMAPLAIDGRVFVGVSGERYGIRGFLAAFDARTGEEVWRFHTIPGPEDGGWIGEWRTTDPFGTPLNRDLESERQDVGAWPENWRMGGGGVATTPAYDPESRRLFVNVEGPAPLVDARVRPGDNLHTGSILALDASTGELTWSAQYLPADAWGLSGGSPPFLFDREGERYVAFAGRTGWVYVFRAADGRPILRSDNFVPQESMFARPGSESAARVAPGLNGGNAGSPVAYDARNGRVFVAGVHQPMVYTLEPHSYSRGQLWVGGSVRFPPDDEQWGTVTAIDLGSGRIAWQRRTPAPVHSGVLATRGNLVFVGQGSGSFDAFDAADGQLLWQFNTGGGVHGSPVTYTVAGTQYVVAAAGGSHHFGTPPGDDIIAFALASRRPSIHVSPYPAADYHRHGPATPAPHQPEPATREPPAPDPTDPDSPDVDAPEPDR